MQTLKLAILGGGNMGRALIGGLLRQGTRPEHITVGEASSSARVTLAQEFGITATWDNQAAIAGANLIIVAVKPQNVANVLKPLAFTVQQTHPVVLSVAAGIRTQSLESWCGANTPVLRTIKGGTMEAALRVLESADLRDSVAKAIEAATHRSRELAAEFGNPAS